jgi:hypothetical protein
LRLRSFAVPPFNDKLGNISFLGMFDWFAFNVDGADGADFGAFSTGRATA